MAWTRQPHEAEEVSGIACWTFVYVVVINFSLEDESRSAAGAGPLAIWQRDRRRLAGHPRHAERSPQLSTF
jgi:hypothetical protein